MASNRHEAGSAASHTPRIVVSWLIVGVPLAYGIFQAIKSSTQLFTGFTPPERSTRSSPGVRTDNR